MLARLADELDSALIVTRSAAMCLLGVHPFAVSTSWEAAFPSRFILGIGGAFLSVPAIH